MPAAVLWMRAPSASLAAPAADSRSAFWRSIDCACAAISPRHFFRRPRDPFRQPNARVPRRNRTGRTSSPAPGGIQHRLRAFRTMLACRLLVAPHGGGPGGISGSTNPVVVQGGARLPDRPEGGDATGPTCFSGSISSGRPVALSPWNGSESCCSPPMTPRCGKGVEEDDVAGRQGVGWFPNEDRFSPGWNRATRSGSGRDIKDALTEADASMARRDFTMGQHPRVSCDPANRPPGLRKGVVGLPAVRRGRNDCQNEFHRRHLSGRGLHPWVGNRASGRCRVRTFSSWTILETPPKYMGSGAGSRHTPVPPLRKPPPRPRRALRFDRGCRLVRK